MVTSFVRRIRTAWKLAAFACEPSSSQTGLTTRSYWVPSSSFFSFQAMQDLLLQSLLGGNSSKVPTTRSSSCPPDRFDLEGKTSIGPFWGTFEILKTHVSLLRYQHLFMAQGKSQPQGTRISDQKKIVLCLLISDFLLPAVVKTNYVWTQVSYILHTS